MDTLATKGKSFFLRRPGTPTALAEAGEIARASLVARRITVACMLRDRADQNIDIWPIVFCGTDRAATLLCQRERERS